jgi:O-antigen/teichoic acid export membrane protein
MADNSGAAMSLEDAFTTRAIVSIIAGGVVVFVALMLIRSMVKGGKRVVWEILRTTAGLLCMMLAGLSSRGSIGLWGTWLGFGGMLALLLGTLIFRRSNNQWGHRSHRNP